MSEIIKFFDELYVGFQYRGKVVDGQFTEPDKFLGFITPHEDNSAGENRRATVNRWSQKSVSYYTGQRDSNDRPINNDVPMPKEYLPHVIKNELLEGFRITDDVKRNGWNGGNVVWRIWDPRGYELEISSANLANIIDTVGIAAGGKIVGRCAWGRVGSNNVLIPENSDVYKKMIDDQKLLDNRKQLIAAKDMQPGDRVRTKTGEAIFCGMVYAIVRNTKYPNGNYRYGSPATYSQDVRGPYHLLYEQTYYAHSNYTSHRYTLAKKNPIIEVIKKGEISDTEALEHVKNPGGTLRFYGGDGDILAMSRDKPTGAELIPQERDIDYSTVSCGSYLESENPVTGKTIPLARIDGTVVNANFYMSGNKLSSRSRLNLLLLPTHVDQNISYNYNCHCRLSDTADAKVKMRAQLQEAAELEKLKKLVYVIQGNEYTIVNL